jgi:hypothetical protein
MIFNSAPYWYQSVADPHVLRTSYTLMHSRLLAQFKEMYTKGRFFKSRGPHWTDVSVFGLDPVFHAMYDCPAGNTGLQSLLPDHVPSVPNLGKSSRAKRSWDSQYSRQTINHGSFVKCIRSKRSDEIHRTTIANEASKHRDSSQNSSAMALTECNVKHDFKMFYCSLNSHHNACVPYARLPNVPSRAAS